MRLGFLVVQYLGFFRVYHAVTEANQLARGRLLHPQLIHSPGRGAVHGGPAAVPDISVRRLLGVSLVRARTAVGGGRRLGQGGERQQPHDRGAAIAQYLHGTGLWILFLPYIAASGWRGQGTTSL